MRNVLLGIAHGYNADNVKHWILSAKKYQTNYDIVLVCSDGNTDIGNYCADNGVKCILPNRKVDNIYHDRHAIWADYLKMNDYDFVLCTDVIDVVFQANPFDWVSKNMSGKTLLVGGEGVTFKEQHWNLDNMNQTFPMYNESIKDQEIICGGMIAGYKKDIIELMIGIYYLSLGEKSHSVIDQAALNVLYHTRTTIREKMLVTNTNDSFIAHLHVSGNQAIHGGYPNYMHDVPNIEDGVVKNQKGEPYAIVHQYNRFPTWQEELYSKI